LQARTVKGIPRKAPISNLYDDFVQQPPELASEDQPAWIKKRLIHHHDALPIFASFRLRYVYHSDAKVAA
jgi:hypothetical protein